MKKLRLIGIYIALMTSSSAWALEDPWMIIAIPDSQTYVRYQDAPTPGTEPWVSQMNWIVNQRDAENIKFVTHEGDVIMAGENDITTTNTELEWSWAVPIMNILDNDTHTNGVIPYGVSKGNHDDLSGFLEHFGPARYETPLGGGAAYDWYGGHSTSGVSHYQTFTAGGRTFLHVNLPVFAETAERDWAASILENPTNSSLPTIITIHNNLVGYTDTTHTQIVAKGVNEQAVWDDVVKGHPQVFMVLSGHYHGEWRNQAHVVSTNDAGDVVYEMLCNMQDGGWGPAPDEGGGAWKPDGWFRTITFIEGGGSNFLDRIHMRTFAPWMMEHPEYASAYDDFDPDGTYTNGYYIHPQTDFFFDLNFMDRLGPTFFSIQTDVNELAVPEGSTNVFQVRLTQQPASNTQVTITHVSGDGSLSVQSGTPLTFTPTDWNTWKPVTLAAAQDSDWENGSASFLCSGDNLPNLFITATEVDDEIDPAYALPWSESFDSLNTGSLDGQHGWTGEGAVQTGTTQSGTQALSITNGTAAHLFIGSPTNIWITFWAQPAQNARIPDPGNEASAVFYVNTNNLLVAYDSTNAIEVASDIISNDWNKFEVSCDYSSKVWNLKLNDEQVVSNFTFYGSPTAFSAIELTELSEESLYVDSINLVDTQSEPDGDEDGDGLPDSWENTYYGGPTNANPDALASNGVNTIKEAYIAGLNPTNPASLLVVSNPQGNVVQWQSISGRVYSVEWTTNLLSSFQPLATNLTSGIFTDLVNQAENKIYYKIKVRLEH